MKKQTDDLEGQLQEMDCLNTICFEELSTAKHAVDRQLEEENSKSSTLQGQLSEVEARLITAGDEKFPLEQNHRHELAVVRNKYEAQNRTPE